MLSCVVLCIGVVIASVSVNGIGIVLDIAMVVFVIGIVLLGASV